MSPHTPTPNPDSQPDQAGPTGLGGEAVSGNFETSNQPNFSDSNNEDQGGGIFSTPELTVDSENVPDPNVISDDDKSRVATVFQKTDASARRHAAEAAAARQRAIAEEMNEAALAAADIPSTATGDIKLPGGKKKHKKAPLIIILALLVLAVGGGFFAAWQMGWIGKENTSGNESVALTREEAAERAFARYASFVLTGTASDSYSTDADFGESEVEKQFLSQTKNPAFWDTSIELLESAQKAYSELENSDELLTDLMNYYAECLEFLKNFESYPSISVDIMEEFYLRDGREVMIDTVIETYAPYAEDTSSVVANYAQVMKQTAEALANKLDFYTNSGCLVDGSFNAECVANFEEADEIPEAVEISDELESTARNFAERTAARVRTGALDMLAEAKDFVKPEDKNEN